MGRQELFSQVEAAEFCGVSTRTIRRAEHCGVLAPVGGGKLKRYRRGELEALPERMTAARRSPQLAATVPKSY